MDDTDNNSNNFNNVVMKNFNRLNSKIEDIFWSIISLKKAVWLAIFFIFFASLLLLIILLISKP